MGWSSDGKEGGSDGKEGCKDGGTDGALFTEIEKILLDNQDDAPFVF